MKKSLFTTPVIMMMLLGGCQAARDTNDASYSLQKDNTAPHIMSNRTILDFNRSHLNGMDAHNQNPNFPNLNGTINGMASGGSGNYATDTDQAKRVINHSREFRPESIWIDRHYMHVTVSEKTPLTNQQRKTAEADLHLKLIQALPRYDIDVRNVNK